MIGWVPAVGVATVADVVQTNLSLGSIVIALAVLGASALALRRTKALEAWKETASAASLGRAEAQARAVELDKALERERALVTQVQERLDFEKRKTDLGPLMEKVIEVLSTSQASEDRAGQRHDDMMKLLAQVVKNTAHE